MYQFLADMVVILHFAFVVFVILGAFLAFKWKRTIWLHLPAVVWGALIEFAGWVCPLTPLENWLRGEAGERPYSRGFIDHYILPILYPTPLTRELQLVLGTLVLLINGVAYYYLLKKS